MIALQGVTPEALAERVPGVRLEEARRLVSAVHREVGLVAPPRAVRRSALSATLAASHVPELAVLSERTSVLDPFRKLLLRTADGHAIETVRIPLERKGRVSVCVSSQVGCAIACRFCATGRLGLTRNLETWEIVEQVRAVRRTLRDGRVHGVVFQGMGEPLANLDAVIPAIRVLGDPSAQAIDQRAMTVCTSGLPSGIRRLAREVPRVRLGVSLGSARPEVRERLMPITRAHSLAEVIDAGEEHATTTGLAPLWALTLLAGENDHDADADALAALARRFAERTGLRPRLSIIPYNSIAEHDDPYRRTSDVGERAFRDRLSSQGVFSHRRYSGGGDVAAACGQLAARA